MVITARQWTESQALDLLNRIAQRDESALEELHRCMAKRIYAFALNRLHDESEAESVVVETLFAVWEKPQQFRGNSKLSTWILGIARNKVLDIRGRRPRPAEDLDELAEELESDGLGVFELVARQQDRKQILGCLETLPEAQRECLHLVFYEGHALKEIAQFQSVPEGTVRTRLFHARKAMRRCLEAINGVSPPATKPQPRREVP